MTTAQTVEDPALRRKALEEALRVTEDQLRSVRDKAQQLGVLQRQLARQVRELRRLLSAAGAARTAESVTGRT